VPRTASCLSRPDGDWIAFAEAGRKVVMVRLVLAAHFIAITVTIAMLAPNIRRRNASSRTGVFFIVP